MTLWPTELLKLVDKHLRSIASEERRRYPPVGCPFRPKMFTAGRMVEEEAGDLGERGKRP
jgi:hypothetical protein